jgi:hypothetical protein
MTPRDALAALRAREPRMPLAEAARWAAAFPGDDSAMEALAAVVRARGHFLRDEFLTAYRWKTHRTIHLAEHYSEAEIADVTAVAFRQPDEKLRVSLLRVLDGVDYPVASTLLHIGVSSDYPIFDFRAIWSLGSAVPSAPSFEFWWAYVECCRELAAAAHLTVRELDRALWAYSAANQAPGGGR